MTAFVLPVALLLAGIVVLVRVAKRSRVPTRLLPWTVAAITLAALVGALPGIVLLVLAIPALATGPTHVGPLWWATMYGIVAGGAALGVGLAAAGIGRVVGRPLARAVRAVLTWAPGTALTLVVANTLKHDASLFVLLPLVLAIGVAGAIGFASVRYER